MDRRAAGPAGQAGDSVTTMVTLYFAPGTCALTSFIAMKDAGIYYRLERVDFSKAEQKSAA